MPNKEAPPAGGEGQTGAQGNAADGQQQGTAGAGSTAATNTPPKELTIKTKGGREVTLPIERVTELAQKGFDYDRKMAELKSKAANLEEFDRFQAQIQASPVLKEAMMRASENPDLVLQALKGQAARAAAPAQTGDDGDEGDEAPAATAGQMPNEVAERLQQLTGAVQGLLSEREQNKREALIEQHIKEIPWVRGNKAAQVLVREHVNALVASGSRESADELVDLASDHVRRVLEESDTQRVRAAEQKQQFRTSDPSRGQSSLTPPKKFKFQDLSNGEIVKAALQRGRETFGDIFK